MSMSQRGSRTRTRSCMMRWRKWRCTPCRRIATIISLFSITLQTKTSTRAYKVSTHIQRAIRTITSLSLRLKPRSERRSSSDYRLVLTFTLADRPLQSQVKQWSRYVQLQDARTCVQRIKEPLQSIARIWWTAPGLCGGLGSGARQQRRISWRTKHADHAIRRRLSR